MTRILTTTLAAFALAGCLGGGGGSASSEASASNTVNVSNEGYATPSSVSVVTHTE